MPLRQCLHPEAGAKEIQLPSYYWKFSDLKKEFVHSKSGDLSRALIPINDVSKLPNMPALPQAPTSLADIINGKFIDNYPYDVNKESFPFHYLRKSRSSSTTTVASIDGNYCRDKTKKHATKHVWVNLFRLPGSRNDYYSNDPF